MAVVQSADQERAPLLGHGREPKAKTRPGEPNSVGSQAFNDAVVIVVIAWLILLFLSISLRSHNV